jgi:hypothetical protein
LGGTPIVTLSIGAHQLDDYVWGYRYEEKEGLTIWLDNRGGRFNDLPTHYPDLKRGAAIDLRRGLSVLRTPTTVKLPRTWVEGLRYEFFFGAALLRLDCIHWMDRLANFRYASRTSWTDTEVATIAASILSQVGLTLASGTFGFTTNFAVSVRRDGDDALNDLMERVREVLYAGLDGQILHKQLDPSESPGYAYDWSDGGGPNHPMLRESAAVAVHTHVAESSPRYNTVSAVGGHVGQYSGSASDAAEVAKVGTRRRSIVDRRLSSDAKCTERAQAELQKWQATSVSGTVVARPNFSLALHDMISVAAPPWGGPTLTGRVTNYVEEYARARGIWEQRIHIGGAAPRALTAAALRDGALTGQQIAALPVAANAYQVTEGDGGRILLALTSEEDAGVGTTTTIETRGKDATSPEGYKELVAVTNDGQAHSGVASIVISLSTENGVIEFTGALRMRMGETYLEMTEQSGGDPDAPGEDRVRFYLKDNGSGKSQLCARFNTGAVQVLATEP